LTPALALHKQGEWDGAEALYKEILQSQPRHFDALQLLATIAAQRKHSADALQLFEQALAIDPEHASSHNNRGNALLDLKRHDEALASYDRALAIAPDHADALHNRGSLLLELRRHEDALQAFDRELAVTPERADVHMRRSIVRLLLGDFQRGWPEYEWRWQLAGMSLPRISKPRWAGEPLDGRTILLRWEQGVGDTLQFVRYARLLKRQGARVIVACQQALVPLLQRCEGIDELVVQGTPRPAFDCWTPLLSIPGLLGTDRESIPGECGYLTADPALVARWKARLADHPGFRIAIAWQGYRGHPSDAQRSIPLAFFGQLARVPGVRLISLQRGHGVEQLEEIAGSFEIVQFDDVGTTSDAFMDTAAIIWNVDLVVSCDTSVAHLAGALGVPVWVALPYAPDWRWLLDREDSPWYPSMRLFRQQSSGDWDDVFRRMASALCERLSVEMPRQDERVDRPAATPTRTAAPPTERRGRMLTTGCNVLSRTRHGLMLFNRHDQYIGRSLELYGEFSEDEIILLERFVRPGDTVIDGGANIGTHSIPLARMVGAEGRVLAFEPQRLVFQSLCANVALNSLANVDCRQQALGATLGEIVVPRLDPNVPYNFGGVELGQHVRGERVPVVAIDSLSLPACHLIKLDVEGMEEAVLRGASETIRRHQPVLYVENDRKARSASLIAFIQSLGYRLFWHTPPLYREANYLGNPENVFAEIVSVNMLAVHAASGIAIDDLRPVAGPESRWDDA
jgi:FkbM family methyltransferase